MISRALIASLILAGIGLAGCSPTYSTSGSPSTPDGKAKLSIAVIPKGTTHEFWKAVNAGAERAGKEFDVEIIWKGPLKEDDREEQIKVVEGFVSRGVSGIVLAPLDDTALGIPVKSAIDAKIPVVIFDSALKDSPAASFVATDNRAAGKMAGEHMVKLLGGKGKVFVLRYQEGSASTNEREEGFIEAAKAGGLEIVNDGQYAGATAESAQTASENILASFKSGDAMSVQGIFCPNESSAYGMLLAMRSAGLTKKAKFVGFDSSQGLIEGMEAGEIDALVVQNPEKMGYLAVKTLVEHIQGKTVESRIDTGAALVEPSNLKSDEIQAIINPGAKK